RIRISHRAQEMFGMRHKMHMSGTSENSEFAQMQGAGKVSQRRIWVICKQETFSATPQLG
ncbi:MAG TPA: hypothetical protein VMV88_01910, partial [Gallionella sp.]|nr:hypothetical protein [Gallionella sp.]